MNTTTTGWGQLATIIENGLDPDAPRIVVELSSGGAVTVSNLTGSFYSVMPLDSAQCQHTGVGIHRNPQTGRLNSKTDIHHLEVVIKRARRLAHQPA